MWLIDMIKCLIDNKTIKGIDIILNIKNKVSEANKKGTTKK